MNRDRIWAKPRHAGELAELIEDESTWVEWFDAGRIRQMWGEVRNGGGHPHYESVFMRLAWRACFEEHLRLLAGRAAGRPEVDHPRSEGL